MNDKSQQPEVQLPPPLPANVDDWTRYLKAERTLNDQVEDIHRSLIENAEYRRLLLAVRDSQSVEGSMSTDNVFAAILIREKAKSIGSEVADEKIHTIVMALNVVLRRYRVSRKERANTVGGTRVQPEDNNGSDS